MIHALLGTKVGQTQTFSEDGVRMPVTTIKVASNWITKIDRMPNFINIQLGFGETKHLTQAQSGHLKKAGLTNKLRFLRSIRVSDVAEAETVGSEVKVESVFAPGDSVRVTGTSKGKGFAGVVKRHGFRGGPRTHGQSDRERAPGSIGQTTTPGRVYRGKRMAGRMGTDTVTVRGLKVVSVDPAKGVVIVRGLVPGHRGAFVILAKEV